MPSSELKFNYDSLWHLIDNPKKFELLSYLVLCLKYPNIQFYKTPQTRDNKRDGEGKSGDQKIFLEAKFIEDIDKKKLSHKEVGSNINIAMYELANVLWIFTNGYIQLDLLKFIETHNELHQIILNTPLKIVAIDRLQFAINALRYSEPEYTAKLSQLEFIGYKSANATKIGNLKDEFQSLGTGLVKEIENVRKENLNDFFYLPTFAGLEKKLWDIKAKTEILKTLFQVEAYYQMGLTGEITSSIKVPLGSRFFLIFKVNNFFLDNIDIEIEITAKGLLRFIAPSSNSGNQHTLRLPISGATERVFSLEVQIDRLPFKNIMAQVSLNDYRLDLALGKIEVQNLFFLAPFIGERNNETLSFYKEKIDRSVYLETFFLGLITGEAGVGKSRLIQEIIDHSVIHNLKLFRSELIASEGRKTLIRDIIAFFIGLDSHSFIDLDEQILSRFKRDKNFSNLFLDADEFDGFKRAVKSAVEFGIDQLAFKEIEKIADFVARALLHLGRRYLTMIVIEDIHHGDKRLFYFLSRLYNRLKVEKSKIVMLLAGRTEAKDLNSAFIDFEMTISGDPTYSITNTVVTPLSDKDSLTLIKELVLTESKFEQTIIDKVLNKTGNNPFNIIHTLLNLKNKGVIVEKDNDFEWHSIRSLDEPEIHVEIEKLFNERFRFYLTRSPFKESILDLLGIISLFESRVEIAVLHKIWERGNLEDIINFLVKERILRIYGNYVQFDHENILQYFQSNFLKSAVGGGESIIQWIKYNNYERIHLSLFVRSLNVCFERYSKEFFHYCWLYLQKAINNDVWAEIVKYGTLLLSRAGDGEDFISDYKKNSAKDSILSVQAEFCDLQQAVVDYEKLDLEITSKVKPAFNKSRSHKSNFILLLKVKLFRADALIQANKYLKARNILNELVKLIISFRKSLEEEKDIAIIDGFHAWALNRIGITYRPQGDITESIKYIRRSLKLARKIGNEYYVHHNYYDLAGNLVRLNKWDEAFATHKKCLMPILHKSDRVNAKIRTQIRTGLFYAFSGHLDLGEMEMESAIILARERGYLWELTRGLINQANLYIVQRKFKLAKETYKTVLHYVDTLKAKSFYLCMNNNLGFLYLFYYQQTFEIEFLKESITYTLQLMREINSDEFLDTKLSNTSYSIGLTNLFLYNEFIITHNVQSREVNDPIIEIKSFCKQFEHIKEKIFLPEYTERLKCNLTDDLSFYLMYMSFS